MRDITAKELVVMQVEIGRSTTDWDFGKQLLELFANHDKRLVPQSLSIWGDKIADFSAVDDARPHWAGIGQIRGNGSLSEFHVGIGWHRKLTTRYQAEIQHERRDNRGRLIPANLSVYAKPHKAIDWGTFANKIYALTEAQYGFVHMYRDANLRADRSEAREATWITSQRTSTGVPQLGWSTFLGASYAEFIPNSLRNCDHAGIKEIGSGTAITLTKSIMDISEKYEDFDTKRSQMKALFSENFFEIP